VLQPFAVALLLGLVTSIVTVLFLVPTLVAAVGGLRPPPVVTPDTPDGIPPDAVHHGKHERVDDAETTTPREGSAVMKRSRSYGIASLFVAAALGLAGCQTAASGSEAEEAIAAAASVETAEDGGPARLTLTEDSVERLRLETAPVEGSGTSLTIPYAAVVYDADGATWAFVEVDERVYQRQAITITSVDGDRVRISEGPEPGAEVVIVAAAELVGVEAGISGGE
jgi:hypothetical protein